MDADEGCAPHMTSVYRTFYDDSLFHVVPFTIDNAPQPQQESAEAGPSSVSAAECTSTAGAGAGTDAVHCSSRGLSRRRRAADDGGDDSIHCDGPDSSATGWSGCDAAEVASGQSPDHANSTKPGSSDGDKPGGGKPSTKDQLQMDALRKELHFAASSDQQQLQPILMEKNDYDSITVPLESGIDCTNLSVELSNAAAMKGASKKAKKIVKKKLSVTLDKVGDTLERQGWAVCDNFVPAGKSFAQPLGFESCR